MDAAPIPPSILVGMTGGLVIAVSAAGGRRRAQLGRSRLGPQLRRRNALPLPRRPAQGSASHQRGKAALDEACKLGFFKKLDIVNANVDYTFNDDSARAAVDEWMAINRNLLVSAMQKQTLPAGQAPLIAEERKVLDKSKTLAIKGLKLVKEHVAYDPEDEKARPRSTHGSPRMRAFLSPP